MDFTFRPIIAWPGVKTIRPRRSQFKTKYSQTLDLLNRELNKLDARHVVIQLDLPESKIRRDGLPFSGARPDSPGMIVSFDSRHGPLRYMSDTFDYWQDNLRAIALGLENLRAVDRYGITLRGEQYTGWWALPLLDDGEQILSVEDAARSIAELSGRGGTAQIMSDPDQYRAASRAAAKKHHPDNGGNTETFKRLQKAKDILDNHFS